MIIVDNSRLTATAKCSTQAVLSYILGLTTKKAKVAAFAGTCGHHIFDALFSGKDKVEAFSRFDADYKQFAEDNMVEERLTHQNVRDILDEYWERESKKEWPFIPMVEEIEKGVLVPLIPEMDIWFYGKIDMPARDAQTGTLVVVDHKTTGKITGWWTGKFGLMSQMDGYMWSLGEKYNEPCNKVYINAVEFSKLPASEMKCKTHGLKYIECRRLHAKWQLLVTNRTHESLLEWKATAIHITHKYLELKKYNMIELMPMVRMQGKFSDSCTFCDFSDFCKSGRTPQAAKELLVPGPWKPWEDTLGVRED